jgi:hypothetical protein
MNGNKKYIKTMKQYIKPAMTLTSLLLLLYTIYDQHKQIIDYKAKIEISNHVIDSLTLMERCNSLK